MAYCTIEDLIDVTSEKTLIQLTDDAGTGAYDSGIIATMIAAADGEINGYCQQRYAGAIPFDPVPEIIRNLSVDLTLFRLRRRRNALTDDDNKMHDDAIATLKSIVKGDVDLGSSSISSDTVKFTNKTPEDRKFRDPQGYF